MSSESIKKDKYLQYGGQAVIEGVMMRSPRYFAVACRKPDGAIVVQEEPVDKSIVGKFMWMNRPLLRGTLALIDAMALGMKALKFAADVQTEALGTPTAPVIALRMTAIHNATCAPSHQPSEPSRNAQSQPMMVRIEAECSRCWLRTDSARRTLQALSFGL